MTNGTINTQNELLMDCLMDFYKNKENLNKMISIINGETKISLRIVDWFVTNYAKKYYTIYDITTNDTFNDDNAPDGENIYRFKVYNDYKLKLKAYSKKRFDPFCRWERTMVPLDDNKYIETTIGQLNFFKWAIENNVIDFINQNYYEIDADMNQRNSTYKRKQGGNNGTGKSNISASSTTSTETTASSLEGRTTDEDTDSVDDISSLSAVSTEGTARNIPNVITADTNLENIKSNNKTRKKREELSVSACKCVKKETVKIIVKFH